MIDSTTDPDDRRSTAAATQSERLQLLIDLIYQAAVDESCWQQVADELSRDVGGHSVSIWTPLPRTTFNTHIYRSTRFDVPDDVVRSHLTGDTPWGNVLPSTGSESEANTRFVRIESMISAEELARTDYFQKWMAPRGFAPANPYAHVIEQREGVVLAVVMLFELVGLAPITPEHIAFADRLVPHLRRAHGILDSMRSMRREQDVFREVIDRIPSGIVLVDDAGRVVAMNTAARLAAESGDGLRVEDERPLIDDPDENRWLQDALAKARDPAARRKLDPEQSVTGRRSSHAGQTPVLVTPLLAPASDSSMPDTAALIFLGSRTLAEVTSVGLIRSLYDLTPAEAELAMLLADGLSLEEAAERRNVTLNTARSQLKRVFAKTGARRQSDLVRIVLGGAVSTTRHD